MNELTSATGRKILAPVHTQRIGQLAVIVLLATSAGCVKAKFDPNLPAPPGSVDPQYRVRQALGVLAEANKGAVQLLIQTSQSGLLPKDRIGVVLEYNRKIAVFTKSAVVVMQSSRTQAEKAAAIGALIEAIGPVVGIDPRQTTDLTTGAMAALTAVQSLVNLVKDLLKSMGTGGAAFGEAQTMRLNTIVITPGRTTFGPPLTPIEWSRP